MLLRTLYQGECPIEENRLIRFGLFGDGTTLESLFQPALMRLRRFIKVSHVHSTVQTRAEQIARLFGASVDTGLKVLLRQPNLDAILILKTDWYGDLPIQFCLQQEKPMLLSLPMICNHKEEEDSPIKCFSSDRIQSWLTDARSKGVMMTPCLTDRFEPSTVRLQELIATQFGAVQSLEVTIPVSETQTNLQKLSTIESVILFRAIDWILNLLKQTPQHINFQTNSNSDQLPSYRLLFEKTSAALQSDQRNGSSKNEKNELPVVINFVRTSALCQTSSFQASIQCQEGRATLSSHEELTWQSSSDKQPCCENLKEERAGIDMLLDLFCRRVVGGLLPIPDLHDVLTTAKTFSQLQHARSNP